jgi:hypothetical protein
VAATETLGRKVYTLAVLAALALFLTSLSLVISNIAQLTARAALIEAHSANDFFDPVWDAALTATTIAERFNPVTGDVFGLRARILRRRLLEDNVPSNATPQATESGAFGQALSRQPHSGELWALYAMALHNEKHPFYVVDEYLHRATTLAPYRPFVLFNDIEVHLLQWPQLEMIEKERVRKKVDYAVQYAPRMLTAASVYAGTDEILRSLISDQDTLIMFDKAVKKKLQTVAN